MTKTPRSRNLDGKVIRGKELDNYIKAELQAMVREGLEASPIQPSTLHVRLKAKGIVKGGLSTLSSRTSIINEYKVRQHINHEHNKSEFTPDEQAMLAQGRTGAAYIKKAERLDNELKKSRAKYERNILAITDIIEYVNNSTPIKVEDFFSGDLIREIAERKTNGQVVSQQLTKK
ncbi:hypothetical protein RV040_000800 [Vibrio alginolyticus]|uniref:hypothetical protein n=1 Tax=Vibrio harveyi group TaxID=717610 RepID=UPI0006A76F0E|nr:MULTISPECIES: hypothetical protein [Vibrio harveyi group]EJG0764383.1 hypothetical protein [Vibrio parahaemolyticus O5:K30]EHR6175852.1 hypothetical protein [Vibrio parahaemolyticus]EJL8712857.1 hypothetical protein [Vibrio alginolyticus]ELK8497333.1 hypothetical protein [Vibrio alginolyticus]ELP2655155.1 hypothetical protein [Vibrio parahaemolyticus]